jgi:hypothetical protein
MTYRWAKSPRQWQYPTVSSSPSIEPPRQPPYLGVALTLAWFLGLTTVQEGYVALRIARDPLAVDSLRLPSQVSEALVNGLIECSRSALPVALAQVMLGAVLVIVSAGLLFGLRVPLDFAVQTIGVNLALTGVAYYLNEPVRRGIVTALVSLQSAETDSGLQHQAYAWGFRIGLALHLLALAFSATVLTRPTVRRFFTYPAPPRES